MTNLRAEFEKWWMERNRMSHAPKKFEDGWYVYPSANTAYDAYQAGHAAAVPEGWKVVPIEPTKEMVAAADASDCEYSRRNFGDGVHIAQSGEDHWHAMLAAAPTPTKE